MKSNTRITGVLASILLAVALAGFNSSAQMPPGASPPGIGPAMAKLFGKNTAFVARVDVSVRDADPADSTLLPMIFSMLDGKTRMDIDMTLIKTTKMPPDFAATMKQMGMDKMIDVIRPDKRAMVIIYPGLRAYVEQPMDMSQASEFDRDYKVEKTSQGRETVDGHPCEKNKVTISDEKGEKHEALVWSAKDLNDFPVQIVTTEQGSTATMKFRDIKLEKPAASQFDAPGGYTKYTDNQELMQGEMVKRMSGGAGAPPK